MTFIQGGGLATAACMKGAREMATLCKNCNHALVFDPAIQKMHCMYCGSAFLAEEVESEAKKFRENERVLTRGEVYGDDEVIEDFLEGYVYTCSECGGEIVIHGSESSSTCIYCGNPNVVFSRMTKEKRPDYIIPFAITKEQALSAVNQVVSKAVFAPKEVKKFTPEDVRGIYIPYWIVNANHEETAVVRSNKTTGKYKHRYTGRTGNMHLHSFPVDGSTILSDESSTRLEPFDLSRMKPFDEDYLLGFYSNSSDITYDDLQLATMRRAKEIFDKEVIRDVPGSSPKVVAELHETSILRDYKYAMFPVWFVTFRCDGQPHTILINGQTGKVVCGLPWRKKLFWAVTIAGGILVSVATIFILNEIIKACGSKGIGEYHSKDDPAAILGDIGMILSMSLPFVAYAKLCKVKKILKLTQSETTFRFVKKRQG